MAYERRDSSGTAVSTTLSSGISSSDTTITIASSTGWPSGGASGDFFIRVESEIIRIASRTSNTLTVSGGVSGRGQDGTSAATHNAGVTCEFVFTRTDLNEANYAVAQTVGKITAQGSLLVGSAANTLAELVKGTSGLPLVAGASTLSFTTLGSGALAADSVGSSQIANNAVGSTELADGSVTLAKHSNMTTDRLLGRDTAGSGIPEELTVGGGVEFTASGGIQRSALTGNVTASAGSGSTTIAAGVVTNAMLAGLIDTATKLDQTTAGTTYVPTVRQNSSTVSKTDTYAKYWRMGPLVMVYVSLLMSASGTAGTNIDVTLPVNHPFGSGLVPLGGARTFRFGVHDYIGMMTSDNSSATRAVISFSSLITIPQLQSGDLLSFVATYPAV